MKILNRHFDFHIFVYFLNRHFENTVKNEIKRSYKNIKTTTRHEDPVPAHVHTPTPHTHACAHAHVHTHTCAHTLPPPPPPPPPTHTSQFSYFDMFEFLRSGGGHS